MHPVPTQPAICPSAGVETRRRLSARLCEETMAVSAMALLALPSKAFAETFTGNVPRIQDGDTFDLCDKWRAIEF